MVKFIAPVAVLIAAPLIAFAAEQEFMYVFSILLRLQNLTFNKRRRELAEVDVYTRDNFEDTADLTARDLESLEYDIAERGFPIGAISGIA